MCIVDVSCFDPTLFCQCADFPVPASSLLLGASLVFNPFSYIDFSVICLEELTASYSTRNFTSEKLRSLHSASIVSNADIGSFIWGIFRSLHSVLIHSIQC
jgi:hypothetical protein